MKIGKSKARIYGMKFWKYCRICMTETFLLTKSLTFSVKSITIAIAAKAMSRAAKVTRKFFRI